MNKYIFKTLFLFKNSIFNPEIISEIKTTYSNQFVDPIEMSKKQFLKLQNIIHYAYNNSEFYKKKYSDVGFHPDMLKTVKDLEKIPLLSKQDIRDNLEAFVPKKISKDRIEVVNTGGTTAIPMKIYWDNKKVNLMGALYFRTIRMYNCDIGSKTVWIWGLKQGNEYLDFRNKNVKEKYMKNVSWYNGFDMTPVSMKQFADFCLSFKPELMIGYVSSFYEYSRFIKTNGIKVFHPKAIWLTAEPVDTNQRSLIEEVFQCQTFSQYGSSEILHIATECKVHNGLHIHADSRFVEITDDKGKQLSVDESGFIVVTDLENYVMPLIRYKNDDISSFKLGSCSCGNNFPMINHVIGRVYNVFKLKSGKQIYGHMFSRKLFTYVDEVKQFQVHQTSYENINIYLVPGKIKDRNILINELLLYFKYYTADEVIYQFHFVDIIEKERSGKLLYTKSDIK